MTPENNRRKKRLVISQSQLEVLRIIYAAMLGAKYHSLRPKHLFEGAEVNAQLWKQRDVLGHYTPKSFVEVIPTPKEWGWYSKGFLKFRETKKGAVVYIDLVRLRKV